MFNSIKDAKKLLEAVEKRFGGNAATRKSQRNLLKQQYENFSALSSEMLDQTFDRLQKLLSQLELLDEKLSQEDRNKADLDTMIMDDLLQQPHEYVTKSLNGYQLSSSTQIMAFVSFQITTLANTKRSINTTHGVSTASTQVNAANFTNIDNFSDVVICAFFASQPNSLKWSATTATKGDILLESAELQEIKTTRTRKAQEGVCLWKYILPSFGVSCDGLVDMIGVMQVEEGPN
ncbi:hypothetical protein Tco_1041607 [Tanacetum coccineum]|uniref:Uncharacterized protein n=1 Tax=Tanacetum coccineum TaxID=301880 RepID=A0ABQ5GGL7_9ASTR